MEITRGYKPTEVGVIPGDWNTDYIENFAHITTGSRNTQDRIDGGQYPFFVRSQTVERINSYSFDGEAVLTAGDGVGTGKVFHYINGKFDVHQRVYRISDFSKEVNGFYFYLYFSTHFYNRIMQMTAKSSVDSVRREMIARMLVPLPPTEAEQSAIAKALSDVDVLLDALERLISKKRDLKRAAAQQLLTGRTRLPGFHSNWEVKRIDKLASLQRGFDLPTSKIQKGHHPVVYSNGVQNHHATFMVKGPGVVTGRSGTIGKVHFVERDFWPHNTTLWVTDFKGNDPKFVFYFLTSIGLERFGTGSGVPTLNRNDVHEFLVRVPPSSNTEQTTIAEILTDMDAELMALEQRREKTRNLKQAMMQELLTGRTRLV
jgi:type I restriction enzyme S subunit